MKRLAVLIFSAFSLALAPAAECAVTHHDVAKTKKAKRAKGHVKKHHVASKSHKHAVVAQARRATVESHPVVSAPQASPPVAQATPDAAAGKTDVPEQTSKPAAPDAADLKLGDNLKNVTQSTPGDEGPDLRSAAVLVVDQGTGKALYAKNPDLQTPIASITKLMTSVVVVDANLPLDEKITITEQDVDHLKYSSSRLPVGTTLTRGELLHLALIASENRAAAALARTYPGGTAACVRAMNAKAASLGMTNTHYVEGTGLNSGNRSTAVDLAKLVNAASKYSLIHRITSTGEYGVDLPGRKVVRLHKHGKVRIVSKPVERRVAFHNTNLLTRDPAWDIGLSKTGFINEAGHCLVMQAQIGARKVIMVLLDSEGKMSRIGDATRVRRWLESIGNPT